MKTSHISRWYSCFEGLDTIVAIATYAVSSLGGVATVKLLNYQFCFSAFLPLALLSRSTWILALPLQLVLERQHEVKLGISMKQAVLYALIALGLSAVEICNALSMAVLPGSLYALIKGADIGLSMSLSRLILNKHYPGIQIFAAFLIMGGIVLTFFIGAPQPTHAHAQATESASKSAFGVSQQGAALLCFLGALLNALLTVITEGILKESLRAEQVFAANAKVESASDASGLKLLFANHYALWTTTFSCLILALPALVSGEFGHMSFESSCKETEMRSGVSRLLFALCLLTVAATRFTERLSKHYICVRESAAVFSIVQAARRIFGMFLIALLFQEQLPPSLLGGAVCSGVGFFLHWLGSQQTFLPWVNQGKEGNNSSAGTGGVEMGDKNAVVSIEEEGRLLEREKMDD